MLVRSCIFFVAKSRPIGSNFVNKIPKPPYKNPGIEIISQMMVIPQFLSGGFEILFTKLKLITLDFATKKYTILTNIKKRVYIVLYIFNVHGSAV